MSISEPNDLGTNIIFGVKSTFRIDGEWSEDINRGFIWWPSTFAQQLWSDLPNFHNDGALYRLHCETELVRGRGHADTAELPLAQAMVTASLSAVVYDEKNDCYKLHCSLYARQENEAWVRRVLLAAVALQAIDVAHAAQPIASRFQLAVADTPHPSHGLRHHPDPILQALDQFIKPAGIGENKWKVAGEEWLDARDRLRNLGGHAVTDGISYIKAEFEGEGNLSGAPSKLAITASEHPMMGQGLAFHLVLPVLLPPQERAHMAVHFNTLERTEWTWCHDLGSWCVEGTDLAFHAFIPNVAYAPSILSDLAHDMGQRAHWAYHHLK